MSKERLVITQELCDKVGKLTIRDMEPKEIVDILGISQATVSRIQAANFNLEQYKKNTEQRRAEEREKKKKRVEDLTDEEYNSLINKIRYEPENSTINEENLMIPDGRGQLPGQLHMDLPGPDSQQDMNKLMRFQAAQVDKILMKLSQLNDNVCQLLRAVRNE